MPEDFFEMAPSSDKDERKELESDEFEVVDENIGIRDESGNLLTRVKVSCASGANLIPEVDQRRIKGKEQPNIRYTDNHLETDDVEIQLTEHQNGKLRIDAGTRNPQTEIFQKDLHDHANTVRVSGAVALFRVNQDDLVPRRENYGSILEEPTCEFICPNCGKRNYRSEQIDIIDRSCGYCGKILD